jgi:hypothetical protein
MTMTDMPAPADSRNSQDNRWKLVRAHIAKGDKARDKADQHYIAAGQYLRELKTEHAGTWAEWEALVKERAGIGKSRASELMQIADGRKTVEQVRADTAERTARTRTLPSSPLRSGENADVAPAAAPKAQFAEPEKEEEGETHANKAKPKREPVKRSYPVAERAANDLLDQLERIASEYEVDLDHIDLICQHYDLVLLRKEDDPDEIANKVVEAIGADRARNEAKEIGRAIKDTAGKPPLPDCLGCKGSGEAEYDFNGTLFKAQCRCVRRKGSDEDYRAKQQEERAEHEKFLKEMDQPFSFGVVAAAKDGKVWASGVRLRTEEEAKVYIDSYARHELKKHGYSVWEGDPDKLCDLTFTIKRYDEQPVMWIEPPAKRKKHPTLCFPHGTCGLMGWREAEACLLESDPSPGDDGLDIRESLRRGA